MFPKPFKAVPSVTRAQMEEVDRLMISRYRIELLQMMAHAGRHLAHFSRQHFLKGRMAGRSVLILAGKGGNGGGALAAGRWLHAGGAHVRVVLSGSARELSEAATRQLHVLQEMGVIMVPEPPTGADLILDGLIGYSLEADPQGRTAELIEWCNRQITPVVSLDLPSGLHADSGIPANPCIRASATLTLALPKKGLLTPKARPRVGEIFLADIGVPPSLYKAPKIDLDVAHIFSDGDIVKIQ